MTILRARSLVLAALLTGAAVGQCTTLTTLTNAGTGQNGTMFDVFVGATPITINSFDQCWNSYPGTSNVQIYTKAGTWQGYQNTPSAWTLVGSANGVPHAQVPVLDAIPIAVNVTIPAFTRQAFYITCDSASNVAYTSGVSQLGLVIAADAYLQVFGGVGVTYPFGTAYGLPTDGRLWNGRMHYCPQLCSGLTTLTAGGTGQAGTMFDVENTSAVPIEVTGFDQCFLNPGSDNMLIYTKTGSWNGYQSNPGAWTQVASIPGVPHGIHPALDALPALINVVIPPGATQAFYITSDQSAAVAYTNGVNELGTVIGSDATLQVRCGIGVGYPFLGIYGLPTDGRKWNGRIYYCATQLPASNTMLGQGCMHQFTSCYENFATAAAFDLANSAITMTPNGGGGYTVQRSGSYLPVGSVATPIVLPLSDDASITQPFTVGSFPGAAGLTVCSNGFVSLAPGNFSGYTPYVQVLLGDPATSFRSWHDFNPSIPGSGLIKYEESSAAVVVTWDGVWNFGGTSAADASHMQMQFHPSGVVTIAWGTMSTLGNGHLVGYSPGGPSLDPSNSDLSALGTGSIVLDAVDHAPLTLTASTRPVLNTNWSLVTSEIPPTTVFGVDLFGAADPGLLDLTALGMPGCQLRSTLDQVQGPWFAFGAPHNSSFFIPNHPALLNAHLFAQSAVFQLPPVNAFGAITSNGIDGLIGNL